MGSPLGIIFKNETSGLPSVTNGGSNKNYRVVQGKAVKSLFDSGQFSPYPESFNKGSGSVDKIKGAAAIHGDENNDLNITSIITYCNQFPAMKIDYAHFSYLKNLGVYPNNRLVIARRFSGGVGNDLTSIGSSPLSTIVGYFSDQEDIFTIQFNEEYVEAEGGFEKILNEIGDEVISSRDNKGGQLGTNVTKAFNIIPLPGLMEGVQLEIMKKMGITGGDFGIGSSPIGNPNLIREARRRATPDKGEAGSALKAKFSVKMIVEYEQKFINGVDPTLVYMDIIQNALSFGTSDAVFQYSSAFATGASDLIKNLISGDVVAIAKAIFEFVGHLISSIAGVVRKLAEVLIKADKAEGSDTTPTVDEVVNAFVGTFTRASVGHVVSKYKVRLLGVANALTGSPSTPWHVTIGNPKKPIFSSGDMQCTSVNLILGKTLAFNDLPSSIKLEIELTNARNLGAQEIFNRFNTGRGRSYVRLTKTFVETNDAVLSDKDMQEIEKKVKDANSEFEKQAAESDKNNNTNNKTSNVGSETKSADKPDQKNEQTVTPVRTAKDDYPVNFTDPNGGVLWGLEQTQPQPANATRTGDATTTQPISTTETKPSNQSTNDPNTLTSAIPPPPPREEEPELVFNPGGTSSTTQPENTPAKTTPPEEWVPGKKVNAGSYNKLRIRVEWKVVQGEKKGDYVVSWESSGGVYGDKKFFSPDGLAHLYGTIVPNPDAGKPIPTDSDEFETTGTEESATDDVRFEAKNEFEFRLNVAGLKVL